MPGQKEDFLPRGLLTGFRSPELGTTHGSPCFGKAEGRFPHRDKEAFGVQEAGECTEGTI